MYSKIPSYSLRISVHDDTACDERMLTHRQITMLCYYCHALAKSQTFLSGQMKTALNVKKILSFLYDNTFLMEAILMFTFGSDCLKSDFLQITIFKENNEILHSVKSNKR